MAVDQPVAAGLRDPAVRLAGNPDPAVSQYHAPANPSVHVSLPDQGLGLLAEDDVFRNQVQLYCGTEPASSAGLRTEMLSLAPGESYTLRWSIWPVAIWRPCDGWNRQPVCSP